ncbi:MAG TPA: hemolysin family protein [Terriglobales bacterium]|nr:hemolysin family protein [Terriglobales bacterium]
MSLISYELIIIVLLAVINGIFAMSEVALLSARRSRLQNLADRGNTSARRAIELLHDPNNFLSTVQIGVTVVGIFAGAFGGATLAAHIAGFLRGYPSLAAYADTAGITVVVIFITYLTLILGELVPKRVALNNPERISTLVATPMALLSRVGAPVVSVLSASTNALLWLLRVKKSTEPSVTEDDVRAMIRHGAQLGVFEKDEQQMVDRVFRFADRRVTAIMTLRADLDWLDVNDPAPTLLQNIKSSAHSRLPVCDGDPDHTLGILAVKDYLAQESPQIRDLLKPPLFVNESMPALRLVEHFRAASVHVALVVDEYGVVQGLVSGTDVLEALVGDLPEEKSDEQAVVQRPDGSWLVDGSLPIEDLKELLRVDALPDEKLGAFRTAAGFVIHNLGRIPKASDTFEFDGTRIEVVDMDGNRVDKLLLTPSRSQLGHSAPDAS